MSLFLGNYQVEISGLPTDWIQEGVEKITSIANAYGDSTSEEMPTLKVFQNPDFFNLYNHWLVKLDTTLISNGERVYVRILQYFRI